MSDPKWFVITSGVHTGRLRLVGWQHSAVAAAPGSTYPDKRPRGFHGVAYCPRCFAMISADEDDRAYGDQTWAHEQWHAATDYPIPDTLKLEDTKQGKD
jgi:hypothetical protein